MMAIRRADPRTKRAIESASVGLSASMLRDARKTERKVAALIEASARKRKTASVAREREKLYSDIVDEYRALAQTWQSKFGSAMYELDERVAEKTAQTGVEGDVPKPLTDDQIATALRGESPEELIATATDKMAASAINSLRKSASEVFTRAAVEGLTDNEIHKELQDAWDAKASNKKTYRFVDSRGVAWENARYLQMLTRTTMATLARNTEINTLAQNGHDLAMISGDGGAHTCEVCAAWEGIVISLTGATKGYPTLAEAEADGLFHPNCVHRLEYISDEEAALRK